MAGQAPPHPGSYWQECQDVTTGYPYYWNTINNQVVWECPYELYQYRQSLLTQPPPLPPPPPGVGGLVPGYASDGESEEEGEGGGDKPADELEKDPEFIGPKMPKPESEDENLPEEAAPEATKKTDSVDDLMAQIEAEQPPDYSKPAANGAESTGGPVDARTSETCSTPPPGTVWCQPAPPPPPPITGMGLGSLVSSYSDSDTSDQEEEEVKPVKSHLKQVKGNMDSSGRLQFINHSSWQTEEQKAALESYKIAATAASDKGAAAGGGGKSKAGGKEVKAVASGRKRRIALPGGKFNKSDYSEEKPSSDSKDKYNMQFVKSSTVIPGSTPSEENGEGDKKKKEEDLDSRVNRLMSAQEEASKAGTPPPTNDQPRGDERSREQSRERSTEPDKESAEIKPSIGPSKEEDVDPNDISGLTEDELAEELVEKLQHFKVSTEKISSLKLLAVKIETLYSAWCAGGLSRKYLKIFLENAHRRLLVTESAQLSSEPWTAQWDRSEKRYKFINSETGVTTHINPSSASLVEADTSLPEVDPDAPPSPSPPSPPPATSAPPPPPSSPPPPPPPSDDSAPPPPPPLSSNNEPEDMDMSDDDQMDDDDEPPPMTPPTPSALRSSSGGSTPTHAGVEREETPPSEGEPEEQNENEKDSDVDGEEISSTPPPGRSTPGPPGESATSPGPAPQASSTTASAAVPGLTASAAPVLSQAAAAPGLTASALPQYAVASSAAADNRSLNLTDELSSFYSEIGFSDPVEEPASSSVTEISAAPQVTTEPVRDSAAPPPRDMAGSGGDSGPPSPSGSPVAKKRKKNVKVSSSLSMKKKGINNMLAKWQNIK